MLEQARSTRTRVASAHADHPGRARSSTAALTPVKRSLGDRVRVRATIFRDGHGSLGGAVRYRGPGAKRWSRAALEPLGNDLFRASFEVDRARSLAVRDRGLERPRRDLARRAPAQGGGRPGRTSTSELAEGAELLGVDEPRRSRTALASTVASRRRARALGAATRSTSTAGSARFGAWYELFPRSLRRLRRRRGRAAASSRRSASTSSTCRRSTRSAGRAARAATTRSPPQPGDPGSPWAIGAAEGGHDAVHPELGTLEDFDRLVAARAASSASRSRSTSRSSARPTTRGSTRAPRVVPATGPTARSSTPRTRPRCYEDIVNVDWESEDWQGLWDGAARRRPLLDRPRRHGLPRRQPAHEAAAVLGVADRRGPRASTRRSIFLAEAFTRPAMMRRSRRPASTSRYTYFTWRNTRAELERVRDRARDGDGRVLPAELLRQHARHPPRVPAAGRPAGVRGAARARRDALAELRHLLRLRAARERAAPARQRGVPRLREVRGQGARRSTGRCCR